MQTAISFGATLLGAFTGRKLLSSGTLGRATTTMRDVGRSVDESGDVKRAEETAGHRQAEAGRPRRRVPGGSRRPRSPDRPDDRDAGQGADATAQERHHRGFPGARLDALLAGRHRFADERLGIGQGSSDPRNRARGGHGMLKDFKAFIDRGNLRPACRRVHHGRHLRRGGDLVGERHHHAGRGSRSRRSGLHQPLRRDQAGRPRRTVQHRRSRPRRPVPSPSTTACSSTRSSCSSSWPSCSSSS